MIFILMASLSDHHAKTNLPHPLKMPLSPTITVIILSEYPTKSVAIICFARGMRHRPAEIFKSMNSHDRRKNLSLTSERYVKVPFSLFVFSFSAHPSGFFKRSIAMSIGTA